MTKDYTHYVYPDGSTKKIETMTKKETGDAISLSYRRMQTEYRKLNKLHDRWEIVAKRKRPNTRKKVMKILKFNKLEKDGERAIAIVRLALKMLDDESDLEVIKNILRQVEA